jgi:thiopurine S-methyltransferase
MDVKYWIEKWEKSDLGFHQSDVEPALIKYFTNLSPGTVLVPLCGMSYDMVWLAKQGWKVIGAEVSPIACDIFFEKNKISYKKENSDGFSIYRGDQITIWCGDYFQLAAKDFSEVTAVYDRAALIALPKATRKKYVEQLMTLVALKHIQELKMLLVCLEYSQERIIGPPFSVEAAEVNELYNGFIQAKETVREEDVFLPANNAKFKGVSVFETIYWFENKR